jgi:hypothetical protein
VSADRLAAGAFACYPAPDMPAAEPPHPKRPWYLVAALLAALTFGVSGGCEGYRNVEVLRNTFTDPPAAGTDADRADVESARERLHSVMDEDKNRVFPVSVAMMLLGMTTMLFALRAMAGRAGARQVLIQLVVAQAGLALASYPLLTSTRNAQLDLEDAHLIGDAHEQMPQDAPPEAERIMRIEVAVWRLRAPILLAIHSLGAAFIVIALTRQRSRQFFEAASDPAIEQ